MRPPVSAPCPPQGAHARAPRCFLANRCRRTRLTQIRATLAAKTAADYTYRVAYEDFVREPEAEVARVLAFLGIEASELRRREAVAGVSSGSIGKGRAALDWHAIDRLEPLVHEALARYGYASGVTVGGFG